MSMHTLGSPSKAGSSTLLWWVVITSMHTLGSPIRLGRPNRCGESSIKNRQGSILRGRQEGWVVKSDVVSLVSKTDKEYSRVAKKAGSSTLT